MAMDAYTVHYKINSPNAELLLNIPVSDVQNYSYKPLKWICYATGVILGVEGVLSPLNEDDGDFNIEDGNPACRRLLFTSRSPIRFIDLDGLNDRESSQLSTETRARFRDAIKQRDDHCVISDHPAGMCIAAYLIPHSKGSKYIQALCLWRTQGEEPQIESINSAQNGIFIDAGIHCFMDQGSFAILRTPNFSMNCEDVAPAANNQAVTLRFTPHWFIEESEESRRHTLYSGDCRYPLHLEGHWPEDWPPDFLWDFVYGIVVANKYGVAQTMEKLNVEAEYYSKGIITAAEKDHTETGAQDKHSNRDRNAQEPNKSRGEDGASSRDRAHQHYMNTFDKVFSFWMHSRFGPRGQEARVREMAEMEKQKRARQAAKAKEVSEWQEEVATSRSEASSSTQSTPSSPSLLVLVQSSLDSHNYSQNSKARLPKTLTL